MLLFNHSFRFSLIQHDFLADRSAPLTPQRPPPPPLPPQSQSQQMLAPRSIESSFSLQDFTGEQNMRRSIIEGKIQILVFFYI